MGKHYRQRPGWLVVDDLLAENPELRREVERARRNGYVEGFLAAAEGARDSEGSSEQVGCRLLKLCNLIFEWIYQLDSEPVPRYGARWAEAPTDRDGGVTQLLENTEGTP